MNTLLTLILLYLSTPFVLVVMCRILVYLFKLIIEFIPKYKKCENPLVDDSAEDRFNEFICRRYGCITTGKYYAGMPQATCVRCGHKNKCANHKVKEWSLPYRYERNEKKGYS